ncbi:MAG TPA: hypothetical protein VGI39_25125 [Polyangiaceae bacterium]|jgi:hypothetical protein
MFDQITFAREFFAALVGIDEEIVQQVAAGRCRVCGGPLHRGDFERKPRGALMAAAGEAFRIRFSLCCGREGCRKRTTPPSMRFLGRRVYLGGVVIMASMLAQALATVEAIRKATGVPARTTRRWLGWWQGPFISTEVFVAIRARLIGVAVEALPASIVRRLAGTRQEQVGALLGWLKPITTGSGVGSRLVRDVA